MARRVAERAASTLGALASLALSELAIKARVFVGTGFGTSRLTVREERRLHELHERAKSIRVRPAFPCERVA